MEHLSYLLNKPIEENNTNSRKSALQAIIITFVIIIFSTIRIKFKLEKMKQRFNHLNASNKHQKNKKAKGIDYIPL